jgi:hypothetical protein
MNPGDGQSLMVRDIKKDVRNLVLLLVFFYIVNTTASAIVIAIPFASAIMQNSQELLSGTIAI